MALPLLTYAQAAFDSTATYLRTRPHLAPPSTRLRAPEFDESAQPYQRDDHG